MKTLMKPLITLLLATTSFGFVACGGGGSVGNSPSAVNLPPPPPPPMSATPRFTNITATSGLTFSSGFSADLMGDPRNFAGGAASGDIDGDGDIDLFIVRGNMGPNLLYINDGNGVFTENAAAAGVAMPLGAGVNAKLSGPSFADLDGDGDIDLFIGGLDGDPSFLFTNDGSGLFTDVTIGSGLEAMTSLNTVSSAFGDYDRDGDIDMLLAHWGTPREAANPGETETLWRNISSGGMIRFEAVSLAAGISTELELGLSGVLGPNHDYTFAPNFADIDNDGWPDILSVSDFLGSQIFRNNQDGTFENITDRTQITDGNGMGAAVGDYDNDGDLDWFVSSINGNRLYDNRMGVFSSTAMAAGTEIGAWGWGSCFADFNADGHLDIYQTNGWVVDGGAASPQEPFTRDRTRLWVSDGAGAFENMAAESGIEDEEQGRGVVCADFDGDQDVDVLLLLSESSQGAILWRNDTQDARNITIDLEGRAPNTESLGARIFARIGSQTQMREMSLGSNFTSHNPSEEIFGLGEAISIDELRVVWPDGSETTQQNLAASQRLVLTQP